MRPGDAFSDNVGPPWTPPVWSKGPDQLIAEATAALWSDQSEIGSVLQTNADFSGAGSGGSDESDLLQTAPDEPGEGTVDHPGINQIWRNEVTKLNKTEPIDTGGPGKTPAP